MDGLEVARALQGLHERGRVGRDPTILKPFPTMRERAQSSSAGRSMDGRARRRGRRRGNSPQKSRRRGERWVYRKKRKALQGKFSARKGGKKAGEMWS